MIIPKIISSVRSVKKSEYRDTFCTVIAWTKMVTHVNKLMMFSISPILQPLEHDARWKKEVNLDLSCVHEVWVWLCLSKTGCAALMFAGACAYLHLHMACSPSTFGRWRIQMRQMECWRCVCYPSRTGSCNSDSCCAQDCTLQFDIHTSSAQWWSTPEDKMVPIVHNAGDKIVHLQPLAWTMTGPERALLIGGDTDLKTSSTTSMWRVRDRGVSLSKPWRSEPSCRRSITNKARRSKKS